MPNIIFDYPDVVMLESATDSESGVAFQDESGRPTTYFQQFILDLRNQRIPLLRRETFEALQLKVLPSSSRRSSETKYSYDLAQLRRMASDLLQAVTEISLRDLDSLSVIKDEKIRMQVYLLLSTALSLQPREASFSDADLKTYLDGKLRAYSIKDAAATAHFSMIRVADVMRSVDEELSFAPESGESKSSQIKDQVRALTKSAHHLTFLFSRWLDVVEKNPCYKEDMVAVQEKYESYLNSLLGKRAELIIRFVDEEIKETRCLEDMFGKTTLLEVARVGDLSEQHIETGADRLMQGFIKIFKQFVRLEINFSRLLEQLGLLKDAAPSMFDLSEAREASFVARFMAAAVTTLDALKTLSPVVLDASETASSFAQSMILLETGRVGLGAVKSVEKLEGTQWLQPVTEEFIEELKKSSAFRQEMQSHGAVEEYRGPGM